MRSAMLCMLPFMCSALMSCTLIDQRTFAGPARAPAAGEIAAANLPPLPLLRIRFDDPNADFRPAVAQAVDAVTTRKAGANWDVVAVVPLQGAPAALDRATAQGQADAGAVATALAYNGVPPERVHLALRGNPGAPPREVLLFAR